MKTLNYNEIVPLSLSGTPRYFLPIQLSIPRYFLPIQKLLFSLLFTESKTRILAT